MHTPLCGHAYGEPVEYVEAAAARGISLVTFTCHVPMPKPGFGQSGIRMQQYELPVYRELVGEAREYGKKIGVEVLYGIEAEIFPDESIMAEMEETIIGESFDFILGSLHHMMPVYDKWFAENEFVTDAEKIAAYFQVMATGAATGRYHSLSHPDVIRMYGTLQNRFEPVEHEPVIKNFLDAVADCDTCLEINTSGLIKGDYVVHPDPQIMQWALERDIPFTMGSDAHTPDMVGQYFEEVIARFKAMGLAKLHYFKAGERIEVGL